MNDDASNLRVLGLDNFERVFILPSVIYLSIDLLSYSLLMVGTWNSNLELFKTYAKCFLGGFNLPNQSLNLHIISFTASMNTMLLSWQSLIWWFYIYFPYDCYLTLNNNNWGCHDFILFICLGGGGGQWMIWNPYNIFEN